MTSARTPAEVFPAAAFLEEELLERDWTVEQLAAAAGCTVAEVQGAVAGERPLAPEVAVWLGKALGTGADYWLKLDAAYGAAEDARSTAAGA